VVAVFRVSERKPLGALYNLVVSMDWDQRRRGIVHAFLEPFSQDPEIELTKRSIVMRSSAVKA